MRLDDTAATPPLSNASVATLCFAATGIVVGFGYSVHTFLNTMFSTRPCADIAIHGYAILLSPITYAVAGLLLLIGALKNDTTIKITAIVLASLMSILIVVGNIAHNRAQADCQKKLRNMRIVIYDTNLELTFQPQIKNSRINYTFHIS